MTQREIAALEAEKRALQWNQRWLYWLCRAVSVVVMVPLVLSAWGIPYNLCRLVPLAEVDSAVIQRLCHALVSPWLVPLLDENSSLVAGSSSLTTIFCICYYFVLQP